MKKINFSVLFSHLLLAVLVTAIFLPGEKKTESPVSFLAAIALMELYYIYRLVRFPLKRESASGIISLLWILFKCRNQNRMASVELSHRNFPNQEQNPQ